MGDNIAGIIEVERAGQEITSEEASALEHALNRLLEEIRGCENIEVATSKLDRLGQLQTELARACFKWNMQLSPRLRGLVREFDRSDDPDLRLVVYARIRGGTFLQ